MDGPRHGTQLHRVDHHQHLFAIDLLKQIKPPKPKKNETNIVWKATLPESLINYPPNSVIGHQLVANANDQSPSAHGYVRAALKVSMKVHCSPMARVFGRAAHPESSATIPAI